MKRVLLLVSLLFLVVIKVSAQVVEVFSFLYLNNLIHSNSSQAISLSVLISTSTIVAACDIHVCPNLKVIYGNNVILGGVSKYFGFKVGLGLFQFTRLYKARQ